MDCPIVGGTYGHTTFDCTLPEGQGLAQAVVVTVAMQESNSSVTIDYDPPLISSRTPGSGLFGGGFPLTLDGANFGNVKESASVTVGGADCAILSLDHDQVVCTAPPGLGTQWVGIAVSGQSSNTLLFEYVPAAVPALSVAARFVLAALVLGPAWRCIRRVRA